MKPHNNNQYKTTETKVHVPLDVIAGSALIHRLTALWDLSTRLNILEMSGRSELGTVNAGNISGTWLTGGGGEGEGGCTEILIPTTVMCPEAPNPTPQGEPSKALSTHPSLYRGDSQMINFLPTFPAPWGPPSHQEVKRLAHGPCPGHCFS